MTEPRQRLTTFLEALGPAAVAVSGGVDSMTLAVLAHRVNPNITMFHAVSPAVPHQATERVKCYADNEGWVLQIIDAGEIADPNYLANPANRCYFCKTNLYETIVSNTDSLVLSGTNLDDLNDYRPGLIAASEHQVQHPYVACQINKTTLRAIAKELALTDLQDLPAAPCLSSRIETGIHISPTVLPVINDIEHDIRNYLKQVENVRCRIRHHGVVLEIDKYPNLGAKQVAMLKQIAQQRFERSTIEQPGPVTVENYQQGSAFLKENLAVDVTPRAE